MAQGYWELFWQTGLPEAWLVWRAERKPEAVAALAPLEGKSAAAGGGDAPQG